MTDIQNRHAEMNDLMKKENLQHMALPEEEIVPVMARPVEEDTCDT